MLNKTANMYLQNSIALSINSQTLEDLVVSRHTWSQGRRDPSAGLDLIGHCTFPLPYTQLGVIVPPAAGSGIHSNALTGHAGLINTFISHPRRRSRHGSKTHLACGGFDLVFPSMLMIYT